MEPENAVRNVELSTSASSDEMIVMQSADAAINAEQAVALRSSSDIDHQPQSSSPFEISNVRTVCWETSADGLVVPEKSSEESLSGIDATLTISNEQKSPEVNAVSTCSNIVSRRSPRLIDKLKDSLPDVITRLCRELNMPCSDDSSAANIIIGEVTVAGKDNSSKTVLSNSAGHEVRVNCRQRRWTSTKCSSNSEENTIMCKEELLKLDIGANDGLMDTNPEWLKPFDKGWTREVVFRNRISRATPCDTYYTAPDGKRLTASILCFMDLLCFILMNRDLLLKYRDTEIVRSAGVFRGRHRKIENIKREEDSCSANSDFDSSRKRKSLPSAVPFEHTYGKRSKSKSTQKRAKSKAHKKHNSMPILKLKQEIDNLETTPVTATTATTTTTTTCKPVVTAAARTCSETSNSCDLPSLSSQFGTIPSAAHNHGRRKVCGMDCPGQYGVTPFMECTVCMCLFHPTCAGHRAYIKPFICTFCYYIRNNEMTKDKPTRKFPPIRIALKKQRASAIKGRGRMNPSPVMPRLSIAPQVASLHRSNLPSYRQPFLAASSSSQCSQISSSLNSHVPPRLFVAPNVQLRATASIQTTPVAVAPVINIASSAINNMSAGSSQSLPGTDNRSVFCNRTPRFLITRSFQPKPSAAAAVAPNVQLRAAASTQTTSVAVAPVINIASSAINNISTGSSQSLPGTDNRSVFCIRTRRNLVSNSFQSTPLADAAPATVVVPVFTKSILSPAFVSNSAEQSPVSSVQPSLPSSSVPVNQKVQLPPPIATNDYLQFMLSPLPVIRHSANLISVSPSSSCFTSRSSSARQPIRPISTPCSSFANTYSLITLPSRVISQLQVTRPVLSKISGGSHSTPNSACIVRNNEVTDVVVPRVLTKSSEEAVRPPEAQISTDAGYSNQQPIVIDVDNDTETAGVDELQRLAPASQLAVTRTASDFVASNCNVKAPCRPRNLSVPSPLKSLHAGFEIMLHIFRFLNVADLLRAAQVCRTWRSMIGHQHLWHEVRVERLLVTDWKRAASHFTRVATQHLDLRGMLSADVGGHQWKDLLENISELVTIRQIKFGLCPVDIVRGAVERMCKLDLLSAECIMSASADQPAMFDVVKCARFSSLSHLKLRGSPHGLMVNVESDTEPLRRLDHLKHLSLTTLKLVPGSYLHFLGSLKQLEVLELGDCSCWDTETFECLHHLTHLRSLRLEVGGQDTDPGLGSALKHMDRLEQLELIRYVIPDSLFLVISSMHRLRVLSLWPYVCEDKNKQGESNLKLFEVVGTMSSLQQFEWGILTYGTSSGEPHKVPMFVPNSSSCLRKTGVEVNGCRSRNGDDSRTDTSGESFIDACSHRSDEDESRSDKSGDISVDADDIVHSANDFQVEMRPGIVVLKSSSGLASDASCAVTMANASNDPVVVIDDDSDNKGDVDDSVGVCRVVKVEDTTAKSTAVADNVTCAFNAAVLSTAMFTFAVAPDVASEELLTGNSTSEIDCEGTKSVDNQEACMTLDKATGEFVTGNSTSEVDSEATKSVDNQEVCRQAVGDQRKSSDNSNCDGTKFLSLKSSPSALVWRSINELVNELGVKLPNTKIRMFRVPENLALNRSS